MDLCRAYTVHCTIVWIIKNQNLMGKIRNTPEREEKNIYFGKGGDMNIYSGGGVLACILCIQDQFIFVQIETTQIYKYFYTHTHTRTQR